MRQGAAEVAATPTAGLSRTAASGRALTRTRTRESRRAAASDSYVMV